MRRIARGPNLVTQTYEAVCDGIISGVLAPGQRIVLERLARDLGISPTPLREAVARLVNEGLIVDGPNRKLHVAPLTPGYVRDTFWVRSALEGLAAELAASRIRDADLNRLGSALDDATEALESHDLAVYVRGDEFFHRLIAEAADNSALQRELDALKPHVAYIRGYSQRQIGDHVVKSHGEHLETFGYLRHRDAAQARRSMEIHVRNTSERIVRLIEFSGDKDASLQSDGSKNHEEASDDRF
jgi:DNA-binding GntR family transcriptional regulator